MLNPFLWERIQGGMVISNYLSKLNLLQRSRLQSFPDTEEERFHSLGDSGFESG